MTNDFDEENKLNKLGWKLASISSGEHLKRTLEMYKELDIVTYIEKIDPKTCSGCTQCYTEGNEELFRIYTKSEKE